ncbi:MAG: metal-dependent transcriptional regulator [Planctomycetes bacterium]|nr:metal-dependent transcriptional regulator [Planctomycetota bacterium]
MDFWKAFDQNPITHSAAHHVVAIADLIDAFGYARVSDVARLLRITRGSVSVTLKSLKQRGLVIEDERRLLGLSAQGRRIAQGIRARKQILIRLFVDVLGVEAEQAGIDTCKIEHLVSAGTAGRVLRLLRFVKSAAPEAQRFLAAFAHFEGACTHDPATCPCCDEVCLADALAAIEESELRDDD